MEILDVLSKMIPIIIAFVTLVIVLAKMDIKIGVLEEKVKTLFELWNKQGK